MEVGDVNACERAGEVNVCESVMADSYTSRVARTNGRKKTVAQLTNFENELPGRPCTAFFTPGYNTR